MPTELVRRYEKLLALARLQDSPVCRTVLEPARPGVTVDELVVAVGGRPDAVRWREVPALLAPQSAPQPAAQVTAEPIAEPTAEPAHGLLCFDELDGALTVTEFHSLRGVHPPVGRRLSAGGGLTAVGWSPEPPSGVCSVVRAGALVAGLDAVAPERRVGPGRGELDPVAALLQPVLAEPDGAWPAALLAALELRTGVPLEDGWFARPHRTLLVPAATDQPVGWALLNGVDRELERVLDAARDPDRQTVLRWLVSRLAAACQLWDEPAVGVVVDALKDHFPTHGLYADTVAMLRERLVTEFRTADLDWPAARAARWRRMQAALAIEHVATPGRPGPASPHYALRHAELALGEQWPAARAEIVRIATASPGA